MNLKQLRQVDYYTLVNKKREQVVLARLDSDEQLKNMVQRLLKPFAEAILLHIRNEKDNIEYEYLQPHTNLNEKLATSVVPLYTSQEPSSQVLSNVLDYSFKKLYRRIFLKDGDNSTEHIIQSDVLHWLECCLADVVINDERFSMIGNIFELVDFTETLHHFQERFAQILPADWIERQLPLWVETNINPENLVEHVRTFDNDYFQSYVSYLQSLKNLSKWNFMKEASRYSDHGMLTHKFNFKSSVLVDKDIDSWITFWDNLELPLLQVMALQLMDIEKLLAIAKSLLNNKLLLKSDPAVLSLMLLDNFFESSQRTTERLAFYEMDADEYRGYGIATDSEIMAEGKAANKSWRKNKPSLYAGLLQTISQVLQVLDIEEWLFSYKPRENNQIINFYNQEIGIAVNAYSTWLNNHGGEADYKNFNLQKFNFIVAGTEDIQEWKAQELLAEVQTFVNSENFFWDGSFSESYLSAMRGIGYLLSKSQSPLEEARKLWENFKVVHQGWKVNADHKKINQEAFIYCGIVLLLEHPDAIQPPAQKDRFFSEFLSLLLSQSRDVVLLKEEYLGSTFTLMGLAINQIEPQYKELFETRLIEEVDNLISVINILGRENQVLTILGKEMMSIRIEQEFPVYRKKMLRIKFHKELQQLEKKITILLNSNGAIN